MPSTGKCSVVMVFLLGENITCSDLQCKYSEVSSGVVITPRWWDLERPQEIPIDFRPPLIEFGHFKVILSCCSRIGATRKLYCQE